MKDSGISYTNQNNGPRRHFFSSSAFSKHAVGSPDYGYWRVHGLSRTAGSPVNGPLALFPRHHGFYNTVHYSDAPATSPSGTTTQRDLHLQLRRTPRAPEPSHPQRQELNTVFNNTTVRADTKDTPEGSTETLVAHYTAGRVLPTATPPHRVLFTSEFAFFD